jgi:hypothetical protein
MTDVDDKPSYPGVYLEEGDGPKPIEGVPTNGSPSRRGRLVRFGAIAAAFAAARAVIRRRRRRL